MDGHVRLRELLVGIEGLALLRHLYDGTDTDADRRLSEVRTLLDDETFSAGELTSEADPQTGYRSWSSSYDEPGNPIIALEEPAVWSLVDALPPGRALDAACGTGRHARHLVELGHVVVGIDLTPEMLNRARDVVPGATFFEADLVDIPADDDQFELVVCGLALAHVADLDTAIRELARVTASGGRLVISILHPFRKQCWDGTRHSRTRRGNVDSFGSTLTHTPSKMIRARCASRASLVPARTRRCNSARSSSSRTNGGNRMLASNHITVINASIY